LKIAFVASNAKAAKEALAKLKKKYSNVPSNQADVIVALGGDGFMLATLHRFLSTGKPVYGMNKGTIGFNDVDSQTTSRIEISPRIVHQHI